MTDSTTKKPAELESLRADIDRSDEAIVGAKAFKLRGLLGRAVGHGCSVWSLF